MSRMLATYSCTNGITRRTLLRSIPGLATLSLAAGVAPCAFAQTAASFKLGQLEITVVTDGALTLPLSFALPDRDKDEANALLASAGQPTDMVQSQINVAIVKTPDALILVDTGGGADFMPGIGKFSDNLEAAGIAPDQITHVVFTHAHADHLWGVIDPLDGGSRFAHARHVMAEAEAAYWTKPDIESQVPEMFKTMAVGTGRRMKALGERIERVKPGVELAPGVQLVDTGGHTPGHMSVLLRSGSEQLLIGGDVLTNPVVSFQAPSWRWGPDMEPERAIRTRLKTLQMLVSDNTQLLGYHLPWPGVGRVEAKDGAFRFVQ